MYVTRHIYVDALKLWCLGGHWSVNQSGAWRHAAAVAEVVSPGEFTWAMCPRGGLCFLGTWLILGPPLSLQSLGVLPAWKCSKCLLPFLLAYKTACVCPSLQVSTDSLVGECLDLSVHVCPPKARVSGIFTLVNCKCKAFLGAGGVYLWGVAGYPQCHPLFPIGLFRSKQVLTT